MKQTNKKTSFFNKRLDNFFTGIFIMLGMIFVLGLFFAVYAFVQPTVSPSQSHYYMPQNMQKIFSSILGSPQFHNCSDLYNAGIRKNGVYNFIKHGISFYAYCNFSKNYNNFTQSLSKQEYFSKGATKLGYYLNSDLKTFKVSKYDFTQITYNTCYDYYNSGFRTNGYYLTSSNKEIFCSNMNINSFKSTCYDYYKLGYRTNGIYITSSNSQIYCGGMNNTNSFKSSCLNYYNAGYRTNGYYLTSSNSQIYCGGMTSSFKSSCLRYHQSGFKINGYYLISSTKEVICPNMNISSFKSTCFGYYNAGYRINGYYLNSSSSQIYCGGMDGSFKSSCLNYYNAGYRINGNYLISSSKQVFCGGMTGSFRSSCSDYFKAGYRTSGYYITYNNKQLYCNFNIGIGVLTNGYGNCNDICISNNYYNCLSIGTDSGGTNNKYAYNNENPYYTTYNSGSCSTQMNRVSGDYSEWTNCRCGGYPSS